jgi:hypothetical protein
MDWKKKETCLFYFDLRNLFPIQNNLLHIELLNSASTTLLCYNNNIIIIICNYNNIVKLAIETMAVLKKASAQL